VEQRLNCHNLRTLRHSYNTDNPWVRTLHLTQLIQLSCRLNHVTISSISQLSDPFLCLISTCTDSDSKLHKVI
jgi:hypothetical protein